MPDLVILDGMLPEVHGFEICRQLKTSERFRHIPVIMVSAVHVGLALRGRREAEVRRRRLPREALPAGRAASSGREPAPDGARRWRPTRRPPRARHLKEGVVALKQERLDEAIAAFTRGLAIDQFNDMLHYYLAMTYEKKDMVFHAIDHYEKAIQINPDFYDAITSLANLYQRQEFWRKAVEMWELALSATKDETVRARIKDHLLSLL